MSSNIYYFVQNTRRAGLGDVRYIFLETLPLSEYLISFLICIIRSIDKTEIAFSLILH